MECIRNKIYFHMTLVATHGYMLFHWTLLMIIRGGVYTNEHIKAFCVWEKYFWQISTTLYFNPKERQQFGIPFGVVWYVSYRVRGGKIPVQYSKHSNSTQHDGTNQRKIFSRAQTLKVVVRGKIFFVRMIIHDNLQL